MARSIVGGFLSIFGSRFATFLLMLASTPFIVRALGPAGYGDYQYLLSLFTLLMIFVSSGVSEGVQKFISERDRMENWQANVIGFYLRTAFILAVGGSLAFAVASATGIIGGVPWYHFALLAVLVFAAQYREFSRRTIMGFGYEEYSEPLNVFNAVLQVGIALTLLYGFGWGSDPATGVTAMLLGYIVGGVAVTLIGFTFISTRVSLRSALTSTPKNFPARELLSFNLQTVVLILLLTSLYKVDVILIKTFLGSEQTGYYSAALALAEYLWFVPMSLQALFIHSTSSLWSEGKVGLINRLTSRTTRYTLLLTLLMSVGIAALADRFVPLYYGDGFIVAVKPLLVLLPGALAFAVARPVFAAGQGSGNLRPLIAGTGAAALLNLVLNVVLIPRFGLIGAAFSTSVGYASMLVFHIWSARRIGFNPIQDLRVGRVAATAAVSAVPIFLLSTALGSGDVGFLAGLPGLRSLEPKIIADIVTLAIVPVVGLVVYSFAALATGAIGLDETLEILSLFPAPVGPRAKNLRSRVSNSDLDDDVTPKILALAGILLFVVGVALTAGAFFSGTVGPADVGGGGNATATEGTPTEVTPTDTPDEPSTSTPDDESSATPTPTETSDRGGGGGGTTPPPTESDTPTQSPSTPTNEPTQSPTDTPSDTQTQSPTNTQTQTPNQSPSQPPSTTQTETGTTTQSETDTSTQTPSSTNTPTSTPTTTTDDGGILDPITDSNESSEG